MTHLVYTQDSGLLAIVSGTLPHGAPRGSDAITVQDSDIPNDFNFHPAWFIDGDEISIDLAKAKLCAHEVRRKDRDEQFAPLDYQVGAQIPGVDLADIEAQRVVIREADAVKQAAIDAAGTVREVQVAVYSADQLNKVDGLINDVVAQKPTKDISKTKEN